MKIRLILTATCLFTTCLVGCTARETVDPVVDQRDQHVGTYACEVVIENFVTKQVYSTFLDTLVLSKQGANELLVESQKKTSLPVLQVLPPYAYYGQFTSLNIQRDVLNLTSGPDARFYVYKGYKIK